MTTRAYIVPYDSGNRAARMGAGPLALAAMLPQIPQEEIEADPAFRTEIKTSFELYRQLAGRIRSCSAFPLILGGNCGVSIGAVAGVGADDLAVLWFDAHGDFMTPETTPSGFLDGMCLSVLCGLAFRRLARTIPNFSPVSPSLVVHVGARSFSDGEVDALGEHGVAMVPPHGDVAPALDFMRTRVRRMFIHVDLDVLDRSFGRANPYAADGGLSPDEVIAAIRQSMDHFEIAGLALASFDPACDDQGTIAAAAIRIIEAVLR